MNFFLALLFPFVFANAASYSLTGENLLTGEKITISSENKKGLVVVFLSAKCPCSNSHVEELKNLAENYTDFSFVAIHSNADEGTEISKPYFENTALPFPVIQDNKSEIADRMQAHKTPHSYILLPSGRMAYQGGVSNSQTFAKADQKFLRQALEDLHRNRKVKTPEGRTLGCFISRGEKNVW